MQTTESAGQPGSTTVAPALGEYLDQKPEVANPDPSQPTSEEHTSAGPVGHDEFSNTASKQGAQSYRDMDEPLETTNSVNPEPSMDERGPREAQAHANTEMSTDQETNEDRSVAPHAR